MITIEGLGGKGSVWCAVRFGPGSKTNVSVVDSYAFDRNNILSAPPTTIVLPPVGSASTWYSCSTSPYGPRLDRFEVGTLFDVTNSPDTPNPCMHSTMRGGLISLGKGSRTVPHFVGPWSGTLSGRTYYNRNGVLAKFAQGTKSIADAKAGELAIDRFGQLVADYDGSHSTFYSMLTDWCDPLGTSNPLYTNGAKSNTWLSTLADSTYVPSMTALEMQNVACTHVSARVWKEVKLMEYHQANSYIPASPVSEDTGLGYLIAQTRRERIITMVAIQSLRKTQFNGRYSCVETITYYGKTVGVNGPAYAGTLTSSYTFDAPILTLLPGLAAGDKFLKDALDGYCSRALPRALILYKARDAKTARSDALADVSGLKSNWIENLAQVKGTTSAILPLLAGWRAWKTGDLMAGKRALISAYLSYSYVVAPSIRDYHDLQDNLGNVSRNVTKNRLSPERRRGKLQKKCPVLNVTAELSYYCELMLQLKDNPIAAIGNALENLGLSPSASNIWDLIPLSFVADWFTNIGSVLSRLEAYENNALLRDLKFRVETFKVLWPLTMDELVGFVGDCYSVATPIKYSWYDRRILSTLGSYDPFAGQSFDGLSVSQMTQGGALLSSYRR